MNLKTTIKLIGVAGVIVFASLMTYEFVELVANILYTLVFGLPKSDREIKEQLYEQIKELNIMYFNEKMTSEREAINLQTKIKNLEISLMDMTQDRAKWKVAAESMRLKASEAVKERDNSHSSESKLSCKLADFEKKEKQWADLEKALVKNISELRQTISTLKRENHFMHRDSSDEDILSSHSDSPKPLKSLIKKVKSGIQSSKIINKAQNSINKRLNTDFDFFSPPTTNNFNTNNINIATPSPKEPRDDRFKDDDSLIPQPAPTTSTEVTQEMINARQDLINISPDPNNNDKVPDLFSSFDLPNTINSNHLHNKNVPDIFTFETDFETIKDDSDSLSELLQFDADELKINNKNNILDNYYSIKESENKAGLRRAKKKPLGAGSNMMEDVSFAMFPFNKSNEMALFGVFDGHAGREAADFANTLFPTEMVRLLKESSNPTDMSSLFSKAFASVDDLLKADHQYVGSTATVSFVWTNDGSRYLQVANVGDSSAFLCRNGKAIEMTFDHKASHPLEKKRMIESGIPVSENQTRINGIAVSRSLGNHFIKDQNIGMISEPHVSLPYLLDENDTFLVMASDGVCGF
eukprot:gene11927-13895_t